MATVTDITITDIDIKADLVPDIDTSTNHIGFRTIVCPSLTLEQD